MRPQVWLPKYSMVQIWKESILVARKPVSVAMGAKKLSAPVRKVRSMVIGMVGTMRMFAGRLARDVVPK